MLGQCIHISSNAPTRLIELLRQLSHFSCMLLLNKSIHLDVLSGHRTAPSHLVAFFVITHDPTITEITHALTTLISRHIVTAII